ncbi:MAG: 4-alpha-glucanotransferase, partial [Flaviaesturariibacter sp.]|nr:4-alpha-glucanotransferase [Flaviaesturariibacter sp.]
MFNPVSTYRIQFHSGFTLCDAKAIVPYLQRLGIKTIYASPIFQATPGSTHGYDGLHPHRINPEIGTEEDLRSLRASLTEHGLSWIQDIVPNHMAFHAANEWLMDILEKGNRSSYASFFDAPAESIPENRIMIPFLGASLEEAIAKGEIKLVYQKQHLLLQYYEATYPLQPQSYAAFLWQQEALPEELESILASLEEVMETEDKNVFAQRWQDWLSGLSNAAQSSATQEYFQNRLDAVNKDTEALQWFADQQFYRLCHWQETDTCINYRRFFTVNGLICLNMQDQTVFETYHQYIIQLVKEGVFQGLRIDHIDGLYDPTRYLEQLRNAVGPDTYIIVEKILESEETLPVYWPVQGNTGYDFLAIVNNLFTNKEARAAFTKFYYSISGDQRTVPQQIRDSKALILHRHMAGELDNLCRLFYEQGLMPAEANESISGESVKKIIAAFLIWCSVYRFYSNSLPLQHAEAATVKAILNAIRQADPALSHAVQLLEEAWLIKPNAGDEDFNLRAVHFFKRCMQFSGPLMAKGVEDTLMYVFNRFVGHNEVGDAVDAFGITAEAFHKKMIERQEHCPLSLNGTSTHDTKRGEDVRSRLNVLTDIAPEWLEKVEEWRSLN